MFYKTRRPDLNNPSTTEEQVSFPFPIEPLRSTSFENKPKRSSTHSNDSRTTSPLSSSRTPVLSPAIPVETTTPHPSASQHAEAAQSSPKEYLGPTHYFFRISATRKARKSVKLLSKEPNYYRSQANYPYFQSEVRTITRPGFKL